MHTSRRPLAILILLFALVNLLAARNASLQGLEPYKLDSFTRMLNIAPAIEVSLDLYAPENLDTTVEAHPAILYLMNHGGRYLGTESNATIIADFLADGYLVVTLDCQQPDQAYTPELDWAILEIRNELATDRLIATTGLKVARHETFVIPEGYRLLRNHVYWEIDRHGTEGTMDYLLNFYNRHIVQNHAVAPAETVEQMVKPNGEPIDYKLRMDIVYPSKPAEVIPVVMIQSSSSPRKSWQTNRPHFIGFKLRGYAFVHYDHNYIPMARSDHYGFSSTYSLDAWNGIASNTAAVRAVRAIAPELGINAGAIGVSGHSKASYGATLLCDPGHTERHEWSQFSNQPPSSPEPQPWQGFSSQVNVGYQSMGDGTQRHRSFVGDDYAPTLLACGEWDRLTAAQYWAEHAYHFKRSEVPHLALFMRGIGHTMPYGVDEELGIDRYAVLFDFFEPHLRPDIAHPPVLLYQLPLDGASEVCPVNPVAIRFAASIPPQQITEQGAIRIVSLADNQTIPGQWTVRQRNTFYQWQPATPLEAGNAYRLEIHQDLISESGGKLEQARLVQFTAGAYSEKPQAKPDDYRRDNDLLYQIADAARPPFGEWPVPGQNVDRLPAFSIHPYSSLHYTAGYHIVNDDALEENSGRRYLHWRAGGDASIRIDLGEAKTVSQLIVTSGTETGNEMIKNFRLRYSNEGTEHLQTLLEVEDNQDRRLVLSFEPVHARWFMLDAISRNEPVRIHALEMYAQPRPLEPGLTLATRPPSGYLHPQEPLQLLALADDSSISKVLFSHNHSRAKGPVERDGNRFTLQNETLAPGIHYFLATDADRRVETERIRIEVLPTAFTPLRDSHTPFAIEASGGWSLSNDSDGNPVLTSPTRGELFFGPDNSRDLIIDMDVKIANLRGRFGLLFRAGEQNQQSAHSLVFDRNRIELFLPRTFSSQATQRIRDIQLQEGRTYNLRLKLKDNRFTLLLNGERVMENESLPNLRGQIGLMTSNASIEVKRLIISPIPSS
jgi:hypothetical protein